MSEDIRKMIDKVKNFKLVVNESEDKDFTLNNDTVKTYAWTNKGNEYSFKYHLGYDVFSRTYFATLLGGEFANTYGQGETEKGAVESLKLRLIQLRNKSDSLKI
jgi:hypothetical protein